MKRNVALTAIFAIAILGSFWACDNASSVAPTPITPSELSSSTSSGAGNSSAPPVIQPVEAGPSNPGEITATDPKSDGEEASSIFENGTDQEELILLCSFEGNDIPGDAEQTLVDEAGYRLAAGEEKELSVKIGHPKWQVDAMVAQGPDKCPKTTKYSDSWGDMGYDLLAASNGSNSPPPDPCGDQTLDLDVTVKLEQRPSIIVNKAYIMTVVTDSSQIGNLIIKNKGGKDIKKFGTGKETRTFQYECGDGQVDIKAKTECDEEVETVQIPDCCDACVDAELFVRKSSNGKRIFIDASHPFTANGNSYEPGHVEFKLFPECGETKVVDVVMYDDSCGERIECGRASETFEGEECCKPVRYTGNLLNYSNTGWAGHSCPAGTHAVGGGVTNNTYSMGAEGIAEPGATIGGSTYPIFPHWTFPSGETGYVAQNGGTAQSVYIFVDCLCNPN